VPGGSLTNAGMTGTFTTTGTSGNIWFDRAITLRKVVATA